MLLPTPITDLYLIIKVQRGDRRAFATLYDRHVSRIYRLMRRLTGSDETAEDLTQETFVAVFKALPTFSGKSAFSTWVYGIALNTHRTYCRYSRRTPVVEPIGDDDSTPSNDIDPLAACARREAMEALEAAIQDLPTAAREAFVLVRIEGLSYRDAADHLDIPLGTLQSRLNRATGTLQRNLSPLTHDEKPGVAAKTAKGAKHVVR